MQYSFRDNTTHWHGVPADVVVAELETIRATHGIITPRAIVDHARAPDSPLHPCFEWDDSTAAEAWRRHQARRLIRSIRVTTTTDDDATVTRTVYVHVPAAPVTDPTNPTNPQQAEGYDHIESLKRNPDRLARAHRAAIERVLAAQRSLDELELVAREDGQHDYTVPLDIARRAIMTAYEALQHAPH